MAGCGGVQVDGNSQNATAELFQAVSRTISIVGSFNPFA